MLDLFNDVWGMTPRLWSAPARWRRRSVYRAYPAVNLYGDEKKLSVTSEIPGLNTDDLDISVHGRSLTIKGARKDLELGEGECLSCHERGHGEFSRSVMLPYEIDGDKVEADYHDGLLTITLPRIERDKPRKIEVKAG